MKKLRYGIVLLALLFFQKYMAVWLQETAAVLELPKWAEETETFRQMRLGKENLDILRKIAEENQVDFYECLTAAMVAEEFSLNEPVEENPEKLLEIQALLKEKKPMEFHRLTQAYKKVLADLVFFPLPAQAAEKGKPQFFYENGYGAPRTYGGERTHEGIDLFGVTETEGQYPVVSVTDGVVENVGWLPLGGWRIGIRSPSGAYFYYAHLSDYEKNFQKGEHVRAGELLGLMGDTGYGPEGTKGKFPSHLHFGIYLSTERKEEMSINPYHILLLLENSQQKYHY